MFWGVSLDDPRVIHRYLGTRAYWCVLGWTFGWHFVYTMGHFLYYSYSGHTGVFWGVSLDDPRVIHRYLGTRAYWCVLGYFLCTPI